jgi:hypothetical protein
MEKAAQTPPCEKLPDIPADAAASAAFSLVAFRPD